jgi:hypothetical protein
VRENLLKENNSGGLDISAMKNIFTTEQFVLLARDEDGC